VRTVDEVRIGWVDASIGVLIRRDAPLLTRFLSVLVTSLDSDTDLPSSTLGRSIVQQHHQCMFVGKGLLIPRSEIAAIEGGFHLFNGFDEIWCFEEVPTEPKPADVWIVSPLDLRSDDPPPSLLSWMRRSRCALGLGDGVGMNYATPSDSIAELLDSVAR
jgi:hypothetical protein